MRAPRYALALTAAAVLVSVSATSSRSAEEAKINYKDNISAIFQAKCNSCHNADKKRGGLALDSYAGAMEGGGSGSVIEPGDPANSRLYLLVSHEEEPTMPPSSPKIPDEMIAAIKAWITAGAPETSGSVVVMKEKPKLDFALDPAAMGKPQGEPAMPSGLSTEPVVLSERPNAILALASSPWAPLAAVAGHRQILLYNTQTLRLCGILPFDVGTIHSLKFSRDGGILLAAGGIGGQSGLAAGWDVKTGEKLFEVGKEYDSVLDATISPNRSLVAIGGPSKMLRVYNTADGSLVYECKKHTEWITSVAFSPDGVLLASGDRNGGLVVWEAYTGREFYDLRGHSAMITGLSWRLDSNVLASSSEDSTIKLWNMLDGNQLKSWTAQGGGVEDVRFAKDGRLVSTGRDKVTKLWDQNGKAIRSFEKFSDIGLQAIFTFDDAAIISGDWAGEVRVWNTADGKRLGNLIANPASVAIRLERTRQEYVAAQAEAEAADKALEPLRAAVAAQTEGVVRATKTRDEAQKDVALTVAIRAAAEASAADREATAKAAMDALTAAKSGGGDPAAAQALADATRATQTESAAHLEKARAAEKASAEALATRIKELEAATQAKVAAEKALNEKTPAVKVLVDKAATLKSQVEALDTEHQAIEKAKSVPAVATTADSSAG